MVFSTDPKESNDWHWNFDLILILIIAGFFLSWVVIAAQRLKFMTDEAMGFFLLYLIATIIFTVEYRTNIAAKFCAGDYNPAIPSPLSHKGAFLLFFITCLKAILVIILILLCLI